MVVGGGAPRTDGGGEDEGRQRARVEEERRQRDPHGHGLLPVRVPVLGVVLARSLVRQRLVRLGDGGREIVRRLGVGVLTSTRRRSRQEQSDPKGEGECTGARPLALRRGASTGAAVLAVRYVLTPSAAAQLARLAAALRRCGVEAGGSPCRDGT